MPSRRATLILLVVLVFLGCDALLTSAPDAADLFDGPVEGLTPAELAAFARGDAEFGRPFSPLEGLGPIFNNVSCASCHSRRAQRCKAGESDIDCLARRYAPVNAGNDPAGLNRHWIKNVLYFLNRG